MSKAEFVITSNAYLLKKLIIFIILILISNNCFSIPFERTFRKENQCAEYAAIADAYYEQKNYVKASEYYDKARKAPKFYDAMTYKLACSKALGGSFLSAKELFTELLAKEPSNRTLKESLAYCSVMAGDLDAGINLYESLVLENPEDGNTWKNYIKVLIVSEQKDAAEDQIEKYEKKFGKSTDTESLRKRLAKKDTSETENINQISENIENETKDTQIVEKEIREEKTEDNEEQTKTRKEISENEEAEDDSDDFIPDFTEGFDD